MPVKVSMRIKKVLPKFLRNWRVKDGLTVLL